MYVPKTGYVGVGIATGPATRFEDSHIADARDLEVGDPAEQRLRPELAGISRGGVTQRKRLNTWKLPDRPFESNHVVMHDEMGP